MPSRNPLEEINAVLDNANTALRGMEKWEPRKTVKPRKRSTNALKTIVAVDLQSATYVTEHGKSGSLDELVTNLHSLTTEYLFVCRGMAEFVSVLQEYYQFHEYFQFFVTPFEREIWTLSNQTREKGHKHGKFNNATLVSRFGFNWAKEPRKGKNIYHLALDPVTFSDRALRRDPVTQLELIRWADELRTFCYQELLSLRPTQGGIGRQYLRDPRFYPEPRRKVPRATNDRSRSAVGRVTIRSHAREGSQYQAWYIDQHAAHHYQVQHTKLPDANYIYARGHYKTLETPWKSDPKRISQYLSNFNGLLLVTITYTPMGIQWVPAYLESHKTGTPIYVYSNELDMLNSVGVEITSIIASWGTNRVDTGLAAIGKHLSSLPEDLKYDWLKPALLSVYGCLATKPKRQSFGFGSSSSQRSERVSLPAGARTLDTYLHRTNKATEPSTNNVIHRGMIEAATQSETILYANWLQSKGYRVLAVRVDAVIVEDDGDLPTIPLFDPWRIVSPLSGLQFYGDSAFVAVEMNRGVVGKDLLLKTSARGHTGPGKLGSMEEQFQRKINIWEAGQRGHGPSNYTRSKGQIIRISDGKPWLRTR